MRFLQEPLVPQRYGGAPDGVEGESRSLRDVQEAVLAIGKIQDPQHGLLVHRGVGQPADGVGAT